MKKKVRDIAFCLLSDALTDNYVNYVLDEIIDDVVDDVKECADPINWNEDDVRLAIGRAFMLKLNINY